MVLAAIYHAGKGEKREIAVNVVLFALTAIVAIGRF